VLPIVAAVLAATALVVPIVTPGLLVARLVCGGLAIITLVILASRQTARPEAARPAQSTSAPRSHRRHEQSAPARRLDAAGQITRCLTHDLNNLFSAILGYSELLGMKLPQGSDERRQADKIHKTGERAASLVKQLQDLGRLQAPRATNLNISNTVSESEMALRDSLSRDIDLAIDLDPLIGDIKADPALIERIINSLMSNARDAMPDGGTLTITTANTFVDVSRAIAEPILTPGRYVTLAITDEGEGMDKETMERAFDPFFTTKPGGKTTGLGLSTVYEIVQKHNGHILTRSTPGEGTTVEVYLPRMDEGPLPGGGAPSQTTATATRSSGPLWAEGGAAPGS
jgi:signal transduction histidine kinase